MKRLRLEKVAAISAIRRFKPSRPGCWLGKKSWLMKLGAIISSMALRSALARASIKRRTRALFSSAFDIGASSSLPTPVSQTGRGHENDATRRSLAHRRRLIHPSAWNRYSRKFDRLLGQKPKVFLHL